MTNPEGPPSRRTAPALIAAAATFGTLLSGPALAQPASIAGVAVGSDPGQPMNVTVGVGPAIAPDYEGSDDYELVPFFNLRAGNLYHPETYIQVVGARLVSNFLPHDHWLLGIVGPVHQGAGRCRGRSRGRSQERRRIGPARADRRLRFPRHPRSTIS